jgi:hypothetical protein
MFGVQLKESVMQPLFQISSHNYYSELIDIQHPGLCMVIFGGNGGGGVRAETVAS